ncbi:MAG: RagB/SusD family nutrient uptake outer membrane protein [Parafilimonas sp.]
MKKQKIKYIVSSCLIALVIVYACNKDFLNKQPLGSINEDVLANQAGVEGLLIGTYHQIAGDNNWGSAPSNWVFGSVVADEAYKGSTPSDQPDINPIESWAYNTNNPYFNEKWVSCYSGIGRANATIRLLAKATDISESDQKRILGEARFLRGYFYFELKKMFQNIPYADENITDVNNNTNVPNIDESENYIDIWPQIEDDFKFAMDNVPGKQDAGGRANKWAAMAYLAKAYLFQDKYTDAKSLLTQLINEGTTASGKKYALVNYFSNFNPDEDNSAESVFAFQASVNDGSGTNGNYGDNLNYPNSGGPGGCCGFFNPSITMANAYKTDATTGLPLLDTYNSGNNVSNPTNPYTGTLDPRVDLAIGRPGIPYLDYGPHPGSSWIRDPGTDGYFSPKKTVYAQSQTGLVSTETSFWGPTQMDAGNVNLIRFADIVLWAAETELETGNPDKALEYVNMIRSRAADKKGWVYKSSDYDAATAKYKTQTTPADNYKIGLYAAGAFANIDFARKAIRFERFLELAEEGHRFFDLQRWDDGTGLMANTLNAYKTAEVSRPGFFSINQTVTFEKDMDEIYPLPQSQIDQANSYGPLVLKQNPGY